MSTKGKVEPQNPLILRCHRLMEAFAKSNDERDFYLDRMEGFILYTDLDKSETELSNLELEIVKNKDRYVMIPKLTFYETKKIMEGFVNEKVYDIDTKEKLLDIIQSKEARENFLEFIFDHHTEYEKWQQYYQERSRIRIIEWLRVNNFHFVFEEDLELNRKVLEALKRNLYVVKAPKEVITARKVLFAKAKTYYSNEALNPRPKRGRPPKQAVKLEIEPQVTTDIYTTVPPACAPFLFTPDFSSSSAITFSSKFESEEELMASRRSHAKNEGEISIAEFNAKLASLRSLSSKWSEPTPSSTASPKKRFNEEEDDFFDGDDEDEDDDFDSDFDDEDEDEEFQTSARSNGAKKPTAAKKAPSKVPAKKGGKEALKPASKAKPAVTKKAPPKAPAKKPVASASKATAKKPVVAKKSAPTKKAAPSKAPVKKAPPKKR